MPYVNYSNEASEYDQAAYEHGWVLRDFSWGDWEANGEAKKASAMTSWLLSERHLRRPSIRHLTG